VHSRGVIGAKDGAAKLSAKVNINEESKEPSAAAPSMLDDDGLPVPPPPNPAALPPKEKPGSTPAPLLLMRAREAVEPAFYSYSSTGAISWKQLWNGLLSGQHSSLRRWVAELPLKGCKVDKLGQLDVGASSLPSSFGIQLSEVLNKAVPPLADLVIDALCWRGVFLPNEQSNFDLLSIRLARNHLLFRPAGRRELKPLSLERFLPFGSMSPFHEYMLTKRLQDGCWHHVLLRKAYIAWYKLQECWEELVEKRKEEARKKRATAALQHDHPRLIVPEEEVGQLSMIPAPGLGYIVAYDEQGNPIIAQSEEEAEEMNRQSKAEAQAKLRLEIEREIDEIQSLVADELVEVDFNEMWLRSLNINALRVSPSFIHSKRIGDELHAMTPVTFTRSDLLLSTPLSEQILVLILCLLYKNSSLRAMRISMPLVAANPKVMYTFLCNLVAKVAIANATLQPTTKTMKRSQAHWLHYLKMLQQYTLSLRQVRDDPSILRLPNYALLLGLLLDFIAVLQRHLSEKEIVATEMGFQNLRALADLLTADAPAAEPKDGGEFPKHEREHLHALMWRVWLGVIRRRNSRRHSFAPDDPKPASHRSTTNSTTNDTDMETPADTRVLHWFMTLAMHLWQTVAGKVQSIPTMQRTSETTALIYNLFAWFILLGEPFPAGFGAMLRKEQDDIGGTALFSRFILWVCAAASEDPVAVSRRLVDLWEEGEFFVGQVDGVAFDRSNETEAAVVPAGITASDLAAGKQSVSEVSVLEHLMLVMAPYSGILFTTRCHDPALATQEKERRRTRRLQQAQEIGDDAVALVESQLESEEKEEEILKQQGLEPPPQLQWDPTSETLMNLAFTPDYQEVLKLPPGARASFMLAQAPTDDVLIAVSCGMGASPADCMLAWLKKHHPIVLSGLPDLPPPHPPPSFSSRTLPLERALLKATRAGLWYPLLQGFRLFSPLNVLHFTLQFLVYFTQRRYAESRAAMRRMIDELRHTRDLEQPAFGRRHFFAVNPPTSSTPGQPAPTLSPMLTQELTHRNAQSYSWSQRMIVALLRAGLLIGHVANGSKKLKKALEVSASGGSNSTNPLPLIAESTLIDLTDYDRNFLYDLFQDVVRKSSQPIHSSSDDGSEFVDRVATVPGKDASTSAFTPTMMNDVLSIIPPTVSSSFLLNITSLEDSKSSTHTPGMKHTMKFKKRQQALKQHRASLRTFKDHEAYYAKKLSELTQLLDMESLVGISLEERNRFIRHIYKEMDELGVDRHLRAALWYQICRCLYKHSHRRPDSLVAKVSNSSAEGEIRSSMNARSERLHDEDWKPIAGRMHEPGDERKGHGGAGMMDADGVLAANAGQAGHQRYDPDLPNASTNFERSSELAECQQEILLLYLALQQWQTCRARMLEDLESYWRKNPKSRPVPLTQLPMPKGTRDATAATEAATAAAARARLEGAPDTTPALDSSGRPIPLPRDIEEKLREERALRFVMDRIRGRIYWLMLLHGMINPRVPLDDARASKITFDLNSDQARKEWELRKAERVSQRRERRIKRAVERGGKSSKQQLEADEKADHLEEVKAVEEDALYPTLIIDFVEIAREHVAASMYNITGSSNSTSSSSSTSSTSTSSIPPPAPSTTPHSTLSIYGFSLGLEHLPLLNASQYLPWNGSLVHASPAHAILDAQTRQKALTMAFDEDMDVSRLTTAELRILGEYTIDTRLVLALVEELLRTHRFRTALCVVHDILERFPLLRHTPRMQSCTSLVDMVQLLFWIAHPTLQDVSVNKVLAGSANMPFAGSQCELFMDEEVDPFAFVYKEVLDWPRMPHILREHDQTFLRMRWYSSGSESNQTLILQRLLVEHSGLFQSMLLTLLLPEPNAKDGGSSDGQQRNGNNVFSTLYSRTRPVGVDLTPNTGEGNSSGVARSSADNQKKHRKSESLSASLLGAAAAFSGTLTGTMKSIGHAITGERDPDEPASSPMRIASPKPNGHARGANRGGASAGSPSHHEKDGEIIDVEDIRRWLLTLDEAARVEILDRFVTLAARPETAKYLAAASRAQGMAAELAGPDALPAASTFPSSPDANPLLLSLARRHLPLLCEITQYLAVSIRVATIDLTRPRNKKLEAIDPNPGALRITPLAFLQALATILVKTRTTSRRLTASIPLHYSSRSRLPPDANSPTVGWVLSVAENTGCSVLEVLDLTPAELIQRMWTSPGRADRSSIAIFLSSGQVMHHFINHPGFISLDREVEMSDVSAALVECFLLQQLELDRAAGPPSPFATFQRGRWWNRDQFLAFIGLADRSTSLALPMLAAAFRAQAFVLIKTRDPDGAVCSSLFAEADTTEGLLGWWSGKRANQQVRSGSSSANQQSTTREFIRLSPGTCVEFELLYASYLTYMAAGRLAEMREVAADVRSGLQSLLTSALTRSTDPAPPLITSPAHPNESIPLPFTGASLKQVQDVYLARLQLERCAQFMNNAELQQSVVAFWRAFKQRAPEPFK